MSARRVPRRRRGTAPSPASGCSVSLLHQIGRRIRGRRCLRVSLRRGRRGGRSRGRRRRGRCGRRCRLVEVHLRRRADRRLVLDREVGFHVHLEDHRGQIGRELPDRRVELLDALDVAVARHRDPVLGALELRGEIAEQRVRLELRVVLRHDEKARQRALQLALGLDEFLECHRIVDELRRRLDAGDAGARVGHLGQHLLLLRRVSLDRVDEVRDEIGAALILVQDLGPGGLDAFVLPLQVVVAASGEREGGEDGEKASEFAHHGSSGQGA